MAARPYALQAGLQGAGQQQRASPQNACINPTKAVLSLCAGCRKQLTLIVDPLAGMPQEEMVRTMKIEQNPDRASRRHCDRAFKQILVR